MSTTNAPAATPPAATAAPTTAATVATPPAATAAPTTAATVAPVRPTVAPARAAKPGAKPAAKPSAAPKAPTAPAKPKLPEQKFDCYQSGMFGTATGVNRKPKAAPAPAATK